MKKIKEILLVDDSRGTNSLNSRLLSDMGVVEVVSTALNGQMALDYLKTPNEKGEFPSPNLIFLDINMPVMDGYQFLEIYEKTENKKLNNSIVMLTTSVSEIDIIKAKDFDTVIGYQFKPLTKEKVNQILAQID